MSSSGPAGGRFLRLLSSLVADEPPPELLPALQQELLEGLHLKSNWLVEVKPLLLNYGVKVVAALIILIVGKWIAVFLSKAVEKFLDHKDVDHTVAIFVRLLVRYAIIFAAVVAALGNIGVQTTSVLAIFGAAGLAIGFSLRDSLANFAAGILLVILRPFRVNEYVEMAGANGTVESIQFFFTVMRSPDNKMVAVPNGTIIKGNIINHSRQPERRIDLVIGVTYQVDIERVKAILTELVAGDPRILREKGITVRLKEMSPSSLDFVVRSWVKNEEYWPVYFDLMESIKKELDDHKIGIPFQQLDIHLYRGEKSC